MTSVSQLRKGQRVRVIYEGTVDRAERDHFVLDVGGLKWNFIASNGQGRSVELIEPEYEEGEVYTDADRGVFVYHGNTVKGRAWTGVGTGNLYDFDVPSRPLVHLVPEQEAA